LPSRRPESKEATVKEGGRTSDKIGVIVVAYNAATTLSSVLDRIPREFRTRVASVVVCDDASSDSTYAVCKEYQLQTDLPLTVIRNPRNLGYGGNQKAAFRWAIGHDIDIVVLLHGDGQYAPEVIDTLVRPLETGAADAAFGSRMIDPGSARIGGMPLYKYVGNRVLSRFANAATGLDLSEWHCGYRAYRVDALRDTPFEDNSDGFDFDTEMVLRLHEAGKTIVEVPVPTYYGDEIRRVKGIGYATSVTRDIVGYRLHKMGFGSGDLAFSEEPYDLKEGGSSSHAVIVSWLTGSSPKRILDLGCSDGRLGELLRLAGHTVTGVDVTKHKDVAARLDSFVEADLNKGLPDLESDFDIVIGADVLEHLLEPEMVLKGLHKVLAPGGLVLVSIPNFGHWYPRARVLCGRFRYERRGIFDAGHLRFFTPSSFEHMAHRSGLRIRRRSGSGLPVEVLGRGGPAPAKLMTMLGFADRIGLAVSPTLFSYQLLFELEAS
jgi:glycosyltransferase involved in cell wall biosynthesis